MAPVADERRDHDQGAERRLGVFLGDQRQEFADQPAALLGVIRAEDGGDEIQDPRPGDLAHGRRSRDVDHA